jgi:hypothetical protein
MGEMSDFDLVAQKLEEQTSLNRLEARGTLRICLKDAGFDAKAVTSSQLAVVVEKLLPKQLADRGIENAEGVCRALGAGLASAPATEAGDSPEAIFSRLGS